MSIVTGASLHIDTAGGKKQKNSQKQTIPTRFVIAESLRKDLSESQKNNRNIDEELSKNNMGMFRQGFNFNTSVDEYMQYINDKRLQYKDSMGRKIKSNSPDLIMGVVYAPEGWEFKNDNEMKSFFADTLKYVENKLEIDHSQFMYAVIHRDQHREGHEPRPHMQFAFLPITKNNEWNSKKILTKNKFKTLQTDFRKSVCAKYQMPVEIESNRKTLKKADYIDYIEHKRKLNAEYEALKKDNNENIEKMKSEQKRLDSEAKFKYSQLETAKAELTKVNSLIEKLNNEVNNMSAKVEVFEKSFENLANNVEKNFEFQRKENEPAIDYLARAKDNIMTYFMDKMEKNDNLNERYKDIYKAYFPLSEKVYKLQKDYEDFDQKMKDKVESWKNKIGFNSNEKPKEDEDMFQFIERVIQESLAKLFGVKKETEQMQYLNKELREMLDKFQETIQKANPVIPNDDIFSEYGKLSENPEKFIEYTKNVLDELKYGTLKTLEEYNQAYEKLDKLNEKFDEKALALEQKIEKVEKMSESLESVSEKLYGIYSKEYRQHEQVAEISRKFAGQKKTELAALKSPSSAEERGPEMR